ncbi:MAG: molybdopterin cofactor-binding domain-containing protein [Pseudomonadota bacterium]
MGKLATVTRRTLLVGSAAVAGGVAFGYWQYRRPYANPLLKQLDDGQVALTPYVRIDAAGITVITPRAEMGQGVHTTLAAMVAEELDVELEDITVEHGPASKAYYNAALLEEGVPYPATDHSAAAERMRSVMGVPAKFLGMQVTGGSSSIPDGIDKMRLAGAAAREVLVTAAAERWGLARADLDTARGSVVSPSGDRLAYTELAVAAAGIEPPAAPPLKPESKWRLLGRSLPRVDMISKCTGTAEFGIDVERPNMLYATVRMNPYLGGPINRFDATKANAMPGVQDVFAIDNGIAVIATNTWYAIKAARAVDVDWGAGDYPATTEAMFDAIAASFNADNLDSQLRDDGDVDRALAEADVVEAEYRAPFLAHAAMEPMNATVHVTDRRIDIWAGNQFPTQVVKEATRLSGFDEDAVFVHTPYLGGGFGRRAEMDFIKQAIKIGLAKRGTPIKLTWSREEDMTHDAYRPAAIARLRGAVADGRIVALGLDAAALSVSESQFGRYGMDLPGPDNSIVAGAWDQPYAIDNYRVTGYRAPAMLPVSSWRSVGASQNGFFHESAIDELAHAAGVDPIDMRLAMIEHSPSRRVIEAVARRSRWGERRPPGHALGVAFVLSFGVPTAQVIEIAVSERQVRVLHVWAAVDVGRALDPRNIEAQVQSGINFGLSAAMSGEITVVDGRVQQTNFHQYDGIRLMHAPQIDVDILENGEKIRGIGEPGLPPVAPALANAIFAATGERVRELPLNKRFRFS